ncbi:MAG: Do family serine endopeptidase [candidate division NC10 bacterium]|nr:Do family serine endopeptidase [candidate division NC10 bacterium]
MGRRSRYCLWGAASAAMLACLAGGPVLVHGQKPLWHEGSLVDEPSSDLARLNRSLTQLAALIQPAVVQIGVERGTEDQVPPDHPPLPEEQPERPRVGSGFIISADGYILTNHHVIGEDREVEVELHDGRTLPAKVVGKDRRTDLALLKVDGGGSLAVLPLGDSNRVQIGELVIAAGNPFGLEHTVTVGVVSRKGHGFGRLGFFDDFIQTDASISPGNSGGPLVNMRGEVVGINTAVIPRQRIGFAVPINLAKSVLPQLQARGQVSWGFLGVGIQELSAPLTQALGMSKKQGALVTNILPGLSAEKAGLQRGDVILQFDGTDVTDVRTLQQRVARTPVGTKAKIKLLRQGEVQTVTALIGEFGPEERAAPRPERSPEPAPKEVMGLTVEELTPETAKKFRLSVEQGLVVTEVSKASSAARAGVRPGDILAEVDQKPVKTIQEVQQAVQGWKRQVHLLLIQRGTSFFYVAVGKQG